MHNRYVALLLDLMTQQQTIVFSLMNLPSTWEKQAAQSDQTNRYLVYLMVIHFMEKNNAGFGDSVCWDEGVGSGKASLK